MKNIQKSIRMSQEVYDYISCFDGKNFNDKFENAVKFFIDSNDQLFLKRTRLQKQCLELEERIKDYRSVLSDLERIQTYVNFACDHVSQKR